VGGLTYSLAKKHKVYSLPIVALLWCHQIPPLALYAGGSEIGSQTDRDVTAVWSVPARQGGTDLPGKSAVRLVSY
jgi:hypothetical protein